MCPQQCVRSNVSAVKIEASSSSLSGNWLFFMADPMVRGNRKRSIPLEDWGAVLYKLLVMRKRVQDRCNFVAAPRSIAPYDDTLDLQEGPFSGLELLNRVMTPLEGMTLEFPEYEIKTRGTV